MKLDRVLARPGEPLTAHVREVVQRIAQLAQLRPLPEYPRLWHRLYWATLLHDSGKLAKGFQRSLQSRKNRWGLRHEVLSLAFLDWFGFSATDRSWIIAAVATHHRDAPWVLDRYRARSNATDDLTAALIAELDATQAQAWHDWLSHVAVQWLPELGLQAAVEVPTITPFAMPTQASIRAALDTLEQWIEPLMAQGVSHPDFVQAVLLRGGIVLADHAGSARTRAFTAVQIEIPKVQLVIGDDPFPHQTACLNAANRSVLLIAPTGAGKTEAAILWAGQNLSARLFYVLPYRASMDAMAQRLGAYLPPGDVGLQHGRALQSLYRLLADGRTPLNAAQEASARLNIARLHAYPVRVFSPYHLLRAVYQFKGFEAALTDCYESRIIIDEIHAYDPARLALILSTLALLYRRFAARFLIMTATLPPVVANVLAEALPDLHVIRADSTTFERFRRHRIRICPDDLIDSFGAIRTEAESGRAVLITVNTVRRARHVAALLTHAGCDALALHGRFNGRDRWEHEKQLLATFGKRSSTAGKRPIVVATQVIEVSLDVDFDTIYTDPAPLDALLQRFGRVNRSHRLTGLADVHVFEQPTGEAERRPVYDPAYVKASLAVLRSHDGEPVDEQQVSSWLAQVYQGELADAWNTQYRERQAAFQHVVIDDLHPFESADEGLARQFAELFDGLDVLPIDLQDEYEALVEDDPIGASTLLVPLAYWQYKMLERQGRAWPAEADGLFYTSATYHPDHGLQLEDDNEG